MVKNNLRDKIMERDMTQRECAKKCGISEVSMSRYVNGSRIPNVIIGLRMAEVLSTKPGDIWEESDVQ